MKKFKDDGAIEESIADELKNDLAHAEGVLKDWRNQTADGLREKAERKRTGRKPFPEKRRRSIRVSLNFNKAEFDAVQEFVGDLETADVLRGLVLNAIKRQQS